MKDKALEEITETFCIDDRFYHGIQDFVEDFYGDDQVIHDLPDDYKQKVDSCTLEKIFTVKDSFIEDIVEMLTNSYEDRMPEDPDNTLERISDAIAMGINQSVIDNINANLPRLWYPNGNYFYITKTDLVNCL